MKLFIIGNGFDLHFGLPTTVDRYIEILTDFKLHNGENVIEVYSNYGVDWNQFEEGFSHLNVNELFQEYCFPVDYTSDYEHDRTSGIFQMEDFVSELSSARIEALKLLIYEAEEEILESEQNYLNQKSTFDNNIVISFNYTSTVETFFQPSNFEIFHIHGYYNTNQDNLVFGCKDILKEKMVRTNEDLYEEYKKDFEEIEKSNVSEEDKGWAAAELENSISDQSDDYYVDAQKNAVNTFYLGLKKDFQDKELKRFLNQYVQQGIEEVVVLGHSMGEVDREYMEIINSLVQPKRWIVSTYDNNPNQTILGSYSFSEKITTCDISSYI